MQRLVRTPSEHEIPGTFAPENSENRTCEEVFHCRKEEMVVYYRQRNGMKGKRFCAVLLSQPAWAVWIEIHFSASSARLDAVTARMGCVD